MTTTRRNSHNGTPASTSAPPDASEQLLDEWLAHVWALHEVDPELCRPPSDATTFVLRLRATDLIHDLMVGRIRPTELLRLVHPVGPPPLSDGWWSTPLGRLLKPAVTVRWA